MTDERFDQMVANLLNGNLTDARAQARAFRQEAIAAELAYRYCWSRKRARLAANYLKTGTKTAFQEYCDES